MCGGFGFFEILPKSQATTNQNKRFTVGFTEWRGRPGRETYKHAQAAVCRLLGTIIPII
jgi:hypothetical protein